MKRGRGPVAVPGHLGCLAALLGVDPGIIPSSSMSTRGRALCRAWDREESEAESASHSAVCAA